MNTTGTFHLIFSLLAVGLGGVVLLLPKGTRAHRALGHAYAYSMVGVVGTALAVYDLTGRATPFHAAAIVAGVTLVGGMWTVLARRPSGGWVHAHARWMAWSYIGLVAALVAETSTRLLGPLLQERFGDRAPWTAFWTVVILASFAVFAVGAGLVRSRLPEAARRASRSRN